MTEPSPNVSLNNEEPSSTQMDERNRIDPGRNNLGQESIDTVGEADSTHDPTSLNHEIRSGRDKIDNGTNRRNDALVPIYGEEYQIYREHMLESMEPSSSRTNPNMRRTSMYARANEDPESRERRLKNNAAAKRSIDARKRKVEETNIKVKYLEEKIIGMITKLTSLQDRMEEMKSKCKCSAHW